jgi:hypothetical protein
MLSIVEQFFWVTGPVEVPAIRFSPTSLTDRQIPRTIDALRPRRKNAFRPMSEIRKGWEKDGRIFFLFLYLFFFEFLLNIRP